MSTKIIGAGLSGLIAGTVIPDSFVYEARSRSDYQDHSALLRFRSDIVGQAVGIPFNRVRVTKGIFYKGEFYPPAINLVNLYSRKVIGRPTGERSIINIDPVERWIAPPDFQDQLIRRLRKQNRIEFEAEADLANLPAGSITTAPLPALCMALDIDVSAITFEHAQIQTLRFDLPDANLHQTIYYPDPTTNLYRASITGRTMILEFAGSIGDDEGKTRSAWCAMIADSFGLPRVQILNRAGNALAEAEAKANSTVHTLRFGKIMDIPSGTRHALLLAISAQYGIYSLGRFALWRNILLDDVIQDIRQIQDMKDSDGYRSRLIKSDIVRGANRESNS